MLVIDAHLDLSWNALQWNRDLLESVNTIRVKEGRMAGKGRAQNTVALPEMRRGRVAVSFATMLARSTGQSAPHLDFGSQAQACGVAQGQLAYYRALETEGHARVLADGPSLRRHIDEWERWEEGGADRLDTPPLGFVISMEGADPIRAPPSSKPGGMRACACSARRIMARGVTPAARARSLGSLRWANRCCKR